jgi:hypothetical protein
MIYSIKKILAVEPFKVSLEFNTGERKILDFEAKLLEWSDEDDSIYKQLLDREYFCQVELDPEFESIYWDNGVDLSPNSCFIWATEQETQRKEKEIASVQ